MALTGAVFAAAGSYATPATFTDGYIAAMGVSAALAFGAAVAGIALSAARRAPRPSEPAYG